MAYPVKHFLQIKDNETNIVYDWVEYEHGLYFQVTQCTPSMFFDTVPEILDLMKRVEHTIAHCGNTNREHLGKATFTVYVIADRQCGRTTTLMSEIYSPVLIFKVSN